jgi:hypothetical protein
MSDFESRRARFVKANENRAVQASQGNFAGYDKRDPVEYTAMEVVKTFTRAGKSVVEGKPLQLRFVGGLDESTPRLPGDMKRLSISDVKYLEKVETLDDLLTAQSTSKVTRKYMQIIFPDKAERRTHPLWKLVDAVLAYDWIEDKKERKYHHADDDLFPLFKEFRYNGDPSNTKDPGLSPGDVYLMNCIDRSQMDWHKANKKTLVLSRGSWMSKDKDQNEVRRFNTGTKKTLYDGLCNRLIETYGFHEDFDVIAWRVDKSPWYEIEHALHGFEAPFWAKAGFVRQDEFIERPLTEEELSWELWDFDKYFQPTSPIRIMNRIGYLFKIYDEYMASKGKKSDLWGELKVLADADKAEKEAAQRALVASGGTPKAEHEEDEEPNEPPIQVVAQTQTISAAPASSPVPAVQTVVARRTTEPAASAGLPWDALADGTYNGTKYLGVPLMTPEERALVLSINPDGSFNYAETLPGGKPNLIGTCTQNGFKSPTFFHVEPLSGYVFED